MYPFDRWFGTASPEEQREEPTIGAAGSPSDFASTDAYPEWFRDYVVGPKSNAGKIVTPSSAMRVSAVFASVQLRAGTLAQCPCQVFKRGRKGSDDRKPDPSHPLYTILHDQPNPWQTSMDFFQMLQMHVDLRGNGYAKIIRDGAGRVVQLIPMYRVTPLRAKDGSLFYDYWDPLLNKRVRLPQREVFHLRGLSDDPASLLGLSRISLAKERLGINMAAEEYSAKLLSRGAIPFVVLRHPKKVADTARLKEQWGNVYGGSSNAGGTAILEEGMEMQIMQMTNRDSQFLEMMQFGVKDIARFFDVPGFLIGDDGKSATYASAEQAVMMFEKFTMSEIARNWELTIRRDLLREDEREKWFAEVVLQALQRGDFATRMEGYQRSVGGPWMTPDEARKLENYPKIPGGDKLNRPVNMAPADGTGPKPDEKKEPGEPEPEEDEEDE